MEKKKVHVGEMIQNAIKQRGLKPSEVAKLAGITKQRLNGWMKKDDIYVKDLFTLSKAIGVDLVARFTQPKEDTHQTKVILQIEIDQDKSDQVLQYIKDKELYNIIKK